MAGGLLLDFNRHDIRDNRADPNLGLLMDGPVFFHPVRDKVAIGRGDSKLSSGFISRARPGKLFGPPDVDSLGASHVNSSGRGASVVRFDICSDGS